MAKGAGASHSGLSGDTLSREDPCLLQLEIPAAGLGKQMEMVRKGVIYSPGAMC